MEGIFFLLFFAVLILLAAIYRRDFTFYLFSALLFIFSGLSVIRFGFGDLSEPTPIGILIIFIGLYIGFRAAVEMIND